MTALEPEVLVARDRRIGRIVLNRPRALNALTLAMTHAIEAALRAWVDDPAVEAVLVTASGERAFCAGGDIRHLVREGVTLQHRFWHDEYRLNALIGRFPKPYVSLIDGIVMGGGVGVSFHGSHRVLTDRVTFAMPETAIGMVPDVGVTCELARMPGELGLYLGLTGARLGAADACYAGFGTHVIAREALPEFSEEFAAGGVAALAPSLERLAADPGRAPLAGLMPVINRHFARPSVEAIVASLAADPSDEAVAILAELGRKSPTSLKLTFRLIREARTRSLAECLMAEWGVVSRLHRAGDFAEGVRALLIDKDNRPRWNPPTLSATDDAVIARSFAAPEWPLDLG